MPRRYRACRVHLSTETSCRLPIIRRTVSLGSYLDARNAPGKRTCCLSRRMPHRAHPLDILQALTLVPAGLGRDRVLR